MSNHSWLIINAFSQTQRQREKKRATERERETERDRGRGGKEGEIIEGERESCRLSFSQEELQKHLLIHWIEYTAQHATYTVFIFHYYNTLLHLQNSIKQAAKIDRLLKSITDFYQL